MSAIILRLPKAELLPIKKANPVKKQPVAVPDRKHVTAAEVERLMDACNKTKHPARNKALIWMSFKHGLRSVELVNLAWGAIDFDSQQIHIWRAKRGLSTIHPLHGREMRLLRQLHRQTGNGRYVFMSQQNAPFTTRAVRKLFKKLGKLAGLAIDFHPHMLRHGAGYELANNGTDTRTIQDYLGHRNINHTVRYTALCARRFEKIWPGGNHA